MNLNHCIGADNGAHSTACTIGVVCLRRKIAVFVGLIGDIDTVLRTYYNTQTTTFAAFGINYYFTSHLNILYLMNNLVISAEAGIYALFAV
jgi:hypothetical protein